MSIPIPSDSDKTITHYASLAPTYRPENRKVHRLGPLEIGAILGTIGLFVLVISVVFCFRQADQRRKKAQIAATLRRVEERQDEYQSTQDEGKLRGKGWAWWRFGAQRDGELLSKTPNHNVC